MTNEKIRDIVVVFLSCRWEDTETYCLQELAKLTDDHYVLPLDFTDPENDASEILDRAEKERPGVKLLILVSKTPIRYNHVWLLHIRFEAVCKAAIPFLNTIQEEALCPEHDKMSLAMQATCDEHILSIQRILNDPDRNYFKKEISNDDIEELKIIKI